MTNALNLKKVALAALFSIGTFASGASAMTVHNCTNDTLDVMLMNKDCNYSQAVAISPYASRQMHATSSLGPYRIVLPRLGEGAYFSGRSGDGTFSLIRTGGGNIGIRNGIACQQPQPQATFKDNAGAQVCFRNDFGLEVCLRP